MYPSYVLSLLNTTPVIFPFGDGLVSHLPTNLFFGIKANSVIMMTVTKILFMLNVLMVMIIKVVLNIFLRDKNRAEVSRRE
jgi:hypothetical protein